MIDGDGDVCIRLKDGMCPLLTSCGLCGIRLKYSHDELPEVCRQHPLFIEEYDGFTEKCPSLSCPAVCREVFAADLSDCLYTTPEYNGDDRLLLLLIDSREMIFEKIRTEQITLSDLINGTINLAAAVDKMSFSSCEIYNSDFEPAIAFDFNEDGSVFLKLTEMSVEVLKNECNILEENWLEMLEKTLAFNYDFSDLQDSYYDNRKECLQFFMYLVYRYWLKGVNADSSMPYALFVILGVLSCVCISRAAGVPFRETARMYSKEIEHDTDNVDIMLDFIDDIIFND